MRNYRLRALVVPATVAIGKRPREFVTGTAVAGRTVYVGSNDGHLHAINSITGKNRWGFATSDSIDGSPTVANGVVYVGSFDDNLYAFALP